MDKTIHKQKFYECFIFNIITIKQSKNMINHNLIFLVLITYV
jgi:hypothetical protein